MSLSNGFFGPVTAGAETVPAPAWYLGYTRPRMEAGRKTRRCLPDLTIKQHPRLLQQHSRLFR